MFWLPLLLIQSLAAEEAQVVAPATDTSSVFNPTTTELNVYTHPGIVINQGGRFVGSDHLLNLSKHIDIASEILKPADTEIPLTIQMIDDYIYDKFIKKGLESTRGSASTIPFFNLLLVIYPVEQGFVALVDGRLIESVDPKRVKLDRDNQFQAITWEKKVLLVTPKDDFKSSIFKTIDDILNTFFERYDYFDRLRQKMEVKTDTERMR